MHVVHAWWAQAGMTLLPKNAYMTVLYSSFIIEVQQSYQTGYTQLLVSAVRADLLMGAAACCFPTSPTTH